MPDVVIWMICGTSRVAVHRIPANEVMYADNPDAKGKYCAKIQNVLLKVSEKDHLSFTCFLDVLLFRFSVVKLQDEEEHFKNPLKIYSAIQFFH